MALGYDEARRQATAYIDAFNRTRRAHDGAQLIWVREVGADGLVRSQRLYASQQAAGWLEQF